LKKDLIEEIEGRPAPASPLDAELGMGYSLDDVSHGRRRVETDFPLPPIGRRLKFSPEDIVLPEPDGFGEEPGLLADFDEDDLVLIDARPRSE